MATEVTQDNFADKVENSKGVVIVDFWAEWCPPCRALTPLLEQVGEENKDKVTIMAVDVDANQELAQKHQISSIPTVKLYKDGEEQETWIGLLPKATYVDAIEKYA